MSSSHYFFVKVVGTSRVPVSNVPRHSQLSSVIRVTLTLKTLSHLHVGSGQFGIYRGKPYSLHVRGLNGQPIIPGSTLKGVASHYHLALFGDNAKTSSLFGWASGRRQSFMSRVLFGDARPVGSVATQPLPVARSWTPKHWEPGHVKLYSHRLSYAEPKEDEVAIYVEAIPPDTRLEAELVLLNCTPTEAAELLLALGYHHFVLVGYGKDKGLGKLRIERTDARAVTPPDTTEKPLDIAGDIEKPVSSYGSRLREVFER